MLSDALLNKIRKQARGYLVGRCRIEREVITQNTAGTGEPIRTWAVVADALPCRVIRASKSTNDGTRLVAEQETQADQYRLAVLAGSVALDVDMRVTVGSETYAITRVEDGFTNGVFVMALMERHRGQG